MTVIPSARRLMESLRDIGYELPSAVADLVDNSIDADATRVELTVGFEGSDSWLRLADNGVGMSTALMNEAMRYGSDRDYDARDLGRFGLGLKTASLSQCTRLTVATRTNPDRREIEIRRWDLEHVREEDSWDLLRLYPREAPPQLLEPLQDSVGTVVLWERLDRMLGYRLPAGQAAQSGLSAICREVERHLAMVFHRFISGAAARTLPLKIVVNGNAVEPWDPFALGEPATQRLTPSTISLPHDGRSLQIRVQPYVLPNQMQFTTQRVWEDAAGPKKWNRQQGFYIYRGDRMIQSGGWNRLRTQDEHTKLARVVVDIPTAADAAFEVNVSKMRLLLPQAIRPDMKALATAVTGRAQSAYRRTGGSGGGGTTGGRSGGGRSAGGGSTGGSGARSGHAGGDGAVSIADVVDVLRRELVDYPDLLMRILRALGAEGAGSGQARARSPRR